MPTASTVAMAVTVTMTITIAMTIRVAKTTTVARTISFHSCQDDQFPQLPGQSYLPGQSQLPGRSEFQQLPGDHRGYENEAGLLPSSCCHELQSVTKQDMKRKKDALQLLMVFLQNRDCC